MEQSLKLTYVSNAGVMLQCNGNKVLIDGMCSSKLPIYKNTPLEVKELMISGAYPYDKMDTLLFTHIHSDHFDAESTACLLRNNKDTLLLAPQNVVTEVKERLPYYACNRLTAVDDRLGKTEAFNINGIMIQSISMLHEGKEYENVCNLAYLVDIGGKKVLHVGDAKPAVENYRYMNFINMNIDLLIAPFPYIGLPSARQVIEKHIKPKRIAVVHMPHRELDSGGWIAATMKSYTRIKESFTETVILEKPGEYLNL